MGYKICISNLILYIIRWDASLWSGEGFGLVLKFNFDENKFKRASPPCCGFSPCAPQASDSTRPSFIIDFSNNSFYCKLIAKSLVEFVFLYNELFECDFSFYKPNLRTKLVNDFNLFAHLIVISFKSPWLWNSLIRPQK